MLGQPNVICSHRLQSLGGAEMEVFRRSYEYGCLSTECLLISSSNAFWEVLASHTGVSGLGEVGRCCRTSRNGDRHEEAVAATECLHLSMAEFPVFNMRTRTAPLSQGRGENGMSHTRKALKSIPRK